MKYKNKYGVTIKTEQIGVVKTRFSKNTQKMIVVSFTPSFKYMRCKLYPTPKNVPNRIKNELYLFSTDTFNQKGSHMGNSAISFKP